MINIILSSTLLTWDESQGRREIGPFVHEKTKKRTKTHGKQATAWAPFFSDLRLLFHDNDNNNMFCTLSSSPSSSHHKFLKDVHMYGHDMTLLRPIHPTIHHIRTSVRFPRLSQKRKTKNNNNKKPTNLLLVVVDIDGSFLPFASRDFALKHNVDFTVGAVLHFRKFKICDYEAEEARCAPDVTASATDYITKEFGLV